MKGGKGEGVECLEVGGGCGGYNFVCLVLVGVGGLTTTVDSSSKVSLPRVP